MYSCQNPNGLMKPWTPMQAEETNNCCTVSMWGRTYTTDHSVLFSSLITQGEELLAAPIRVVGQENGQEIRWEDIQTFVMSSTPEKVVLCGTQQSASFILNTTCSIEYDGCVAIDVKVMPRGKTVGEMFGVSQYQAPSFHLEKLWVEIPLRKSCATHFHYWPSEPSAQFSGESIPPSMVSMSRRLPSSMRMGFKPLTWLGTQACGLSWFAESDENWQPADPGCAIEFLEEAQTVTLRLHLLDSHPFAWHMQEDFPADQEALEAYMFLPLTYRFGLQATPVKPYPANPYQEKILHIDCFKKTPGEYDEFLSAPTVPGAAESGFDRMKRLGVTTLILHEKWNKIQNFWELPRDTSRRIQRILKECHARGIKVVPYFGYELSTLSPLWSEGEKSYLRRNIDDYRNGGGWYRKPNQRDYTVCYNSPMQDSMVDGIQKMLAKYPFDGIYLDSTLFPFPCANETHGCGYSDVQGHRHVTYPVMAIRQFLRRLYAIFDPNEHRVYSHISNCCNTPALSFCHLNWDGEYIQMYIHKHGADAVPLDYLQTEYTGRCFGVPSEFLAYTYPNWSFRDALSLSLIHGLLPRPNDIGEPLEIISPIWAAIDRFPIASSTWHPYWESDRAVQTDSPSVLGSYYQHICADGGIERLIFLANPTSHTAADVRLQMPAGHTRYTLSDVLACRPLSSSTPALTFEPYAVHVLYMREQGECI